MKVTFSSEAQADFLEIHKWIHRGNPKRADSFIDELERVCETLGDNPLAYLIVFDEDGNEIRRRAWKNYVIFYRVEPNVVVIMRAGHAAQNWNVDSFD